MRKNIAENYKVKFDEREVQQILLFLCKQ